VATVALIGVGSGDPDVVRVQAMQRISAATLIVADVLTERCAQRAGPEARVLRVQRPGCWQHEDSAAEQMLKAAREGKRVVRLRIGDGFRSPAAMRDARHLRDAAIEFEIVAGPDADASGWERWLGERTLLGRRVVITRMREQAEATAQLVRERGGDPWIFPTIEIEPPPDPMPLDQAATHLASYGVVVFTSANGVERFFEALIRCGLDARALGKAKVAAIGPATSEALGDRGVGVDILAPEFRGESLAAEIAAACGPTACGTRVLVPRALEAREVLPDLLRQVGMQVDVVAAYRTVAPSREKVQPLVDALRARQVDALLLTSGSTAKNLCELMGEGYRELLSGTIVASIGPVTTSSAQQLGLTVGVTASKSTLAGLIGALEQHFGRQPLPAP
jgi:uroporphyrinogen III methyltransferase / synthase